MKRIRNSLLAKYVLIIICAMIIIPFSVPVLALITFNMEEEYDNPYQHGEQLEAMLKEEAKKLSGADEKEIESTLQEIGEEYDKSVLFWVDREGRTRDKPAGVKLPDVWSPSFTVRYMQENRGYEADPFTVVALIGGNDGEGFLIMQVPRLEMASRGQNVYGNYDYLWIGGILLIAGVFMFISFIFFFRIRKRLIKIQKAMARTGENGIPDPLETGKEDEIGKLELAFNDMIGQLKESRKRETEEEELRRELIANLSHDLRTPLTTIRGHAYRLRKEAMTEQGSQSLEMIDAKIDSLGQLIDNLLSYTLLSSGKYPYHPEDTDAARIVRHSAAAWYPVFEKKGFRIELDITDKPVIWHLDRSWFERVLDNLFQNVNRHAADGGFIGVSLTMDSAGLAELQISDHGEGMQQPSSEKGAGIGLTIVDMMLKEMGLVWTVDSGSGGTSMTIRQASQAGAD